MYSMKRRVRFLSMISLLVIPLVILPADVIWGWEAALIGFVVSAIVLMFLQVILLRCPSCKHNILKTKSGYYLWYSKKCRYCGHDLEN